MIRSPWLAGFHEQGLSLSDGCCENSLGGGSVKAPPSSLPLFPSLGHGRSISLVIQITLAVLPRARGNLGDPAAAPLPLFMVQKSQLCHALSSTELFMCPQGDRGLTAAMLAC